MTAGSEPLFNIVRHGSDNPLLTVAFVCSSDEEEIGLQQLEAHWQSWREVSEGADPDSEAVLQQLRSLVQAGVPLVRLLRSTLTGSAVLPLSF